MVPDEEYPNAKISTFAMLSEELEKKKIPMRTIGIVGTASLPHNIYEQFTAGFKNINLVDITDDYERLRSIKSPWEIGNIRKSFGLTYKAYEVMKRKIAPGVIEYQVAPRASTRAVRLARTISLFPALLEVERELRR